MVHYFLDIYVVVLIATIMYRIMEVSQPSLGLQREYLIKGIEDKDVQAYYR